MLRFVLVGAVLFASPLNAAAGGWALASDHRQLRGFAITEVGEISSHSKIGSDFQRIEWLEFNGKCLRSSSYAMLGLGSEAALLLVDAQKNLRLAVLKTLLTSIDVDLQPVAWIQCPSYF